MRVSMSGIPLPESEADFKELQATSLSHVQQTCVKCRAPFSLLNTTTAPGWRETQISGLCEECFDGIFKRQNNG